MNKWAVAGSYIDFSSTTPAISSLPTAQYTGKDTMASALMYDAKGNLEFFIVHDSVFDGQGRLISTFTKETLSLGIDDFRPFGEIAIVPRSNDCRVYDIIATHYLRGLTGSIGYDGGVYWFSLDFNQPNPDYHVTDYTAPLGALIYEDELSTTECFGVHCGYMSLAVSPLNSSGIHHLYIYTKGWLQKFDIGSGSIVFDSDFTTGAYIHPMNGEYVSEMEIFKHPNGYYLAYILFMGSIKRDLIVWELDLDGMANYSTRPPTQITIVDGDPGINHVTGVEFSPNGELIYLTVDDKSNTVGPIVYVDWTASSPTVTTLNVSGASDFKYGFIETGIDGNLYFAGSSGIAALSNPNTPNTTNWTQTGINYSVRGVRLLNSYNILFYLLPDQIDQQDYNDLIFHGYDDISRTITTSGTWRPGVGLNPWNSASGVVNIGKLLNFSAGVEVTIEDMEFHFGPDARMILTSGFGAISGAKVYLDNTLLTAASECYYDKMWGGVEVRGVPSAPQNPGTGDVQAEFHVTNGSVIEKAYTGILAGFFSSSNRTISMSGGYVRVENSTLRDNKLAVEFMKYKYQNHSSLTNSDFQLNNLLQDPTVKFEGFIKMWGFQDKLTSQSQSNFTGNTFVNNLASSKPVNGRGFGFYCIDSDLHINGRGQGATANVFQGLFRGVLATGTGTLTSKVDVFHNTFHNTYHGILLQGTWHNEIIGNEIAIPKKMSFFLPRPFGIKTDHARSFFIHENVVTQINDGKGLNYGIITRNSSAGRVSGIHPTSIVTNNRLVDVSFGIQPEGNNGRISYRCNEMVDSRIGLSINPESPWGSLAPQGQGCQAGHLRPANEFQITCNPGTYSHILSAIDFVYYQNVSDQYPALGTCVQKVVNGVAQGTSGYSDCFLSQGDNCGSNPLPIINDTTLSFLQIEDSLVSSMRNSSDSTLLSLLSSLLVTHHLRNDSVDRTLAFLDTLASKPYKKAIISTHYFRGDTTKTQDAIASLALSTSNDSSFHTLYSALNESLKQGLEYFELDSLHYVVVSDLAMVNDTAFTNRFAAMILAYEDTLDYNPLEEAWPDSLSKRDINQEEGLQAPIRPLLFPNPGTNELNVLAESRILQIEITDISGRKHFAVQPNTSYYSLNRIANRLANGIYIVKVVVEDGATYSYKWIKQ